MHKDFGTFSVDYLKLQSPKYLTYSKLRNNVPLISTLLPKFYVPPNHFRGAKLELTRKSILEIRDRLYDLELETDTVLSSIIRTKKEWNSPKYAVLPYKKIVEQDGVLL